MEKKTLLWVGDAGCPSGFALSTHKILEGLTPTFDVTVLGVNYRGDPHSFPYPIYMAAVGGDPLGVGRLLWMCDLIKQKSGKKPDLIVVQNDPWHVPHYLKRLKKEGEGYDLEYASIPVISIVAVDGKHCQGSWLNSSAAVVFWTKFAHDEARWGGFTGLGHVIPLGVDLSTFYPIDKYEARLRRGLPKQLDDSFIIGNVNRNQPRKRWDLTIKYFAKWLHQGPYKDAYLYLHTAPTGDMGVNVREYATYHGVLQRILLREPATFYGDSESELRDTYNCFDVQVNTGQGEGFGLTTLEGMACGVPQVVGDWSALGEWAKGAASLIPCTSTAITTTVPAPFVIGGVPDETLFIKELERLYTDPAARDQLREQGLRLAHQDRYNWKTIGESFEVLCNRIVNPVQQDSVELPIELEVV